MKATATLLDHVEVLLAELLRFERAADQAVSAYFRKHRNLGQRDRAFVAETAYAVLRRRRTLEAATGTVAPRSLAIAALAQVQGLSGRALEGALSDAERRLVARVRAARTDGLAPAIRAELPDWMWERLEAAHGPEQAMDHVRAGVGLEG